MEIEQLMHQDRHEAARRLRNIARGLGADWTAESVRQYLLAYVPDDRLPPEWLRYPVEDDAPQTPITGEAGCTTRRCARSGRTSGS